ncbi:DedA family protein [Gordonia insulae]|uniref:Putative membrane protein n=1 Tax=Gordonia insulae TaxID=2420509 RepID=A0A3G8JMP8_9ACTN|nr:VTT domain-containing protein [Gordonia insulae]AZG46263.1 putative membrane protein [Gordonia insulae]
MTIPLAAAHAVALPGFLDPVTLLGYFGSWALVGLLLVIAVESGILFPLLPGDSLLFVAGMVIAADGAQGLESFASLWQVLLLAPMAAILGAEVGYWVGRTVGTRWFTPASRVLKQRYVDEAHTFFDRHGPITVFLARFVPVVRTITPIVAGAAGMRHRHFLIVNIIGAVTWASGITLLGYWLGQFAIVQKLIEPIFVLIVVVSVAPMVWTALRRRRRSARVGNPAPGRDRG